MGNEGSAPKSPSNSKSPISKRNLSPYSNDKRLYINESSNDLNSKILFMKSPKNEEIINFVNRFTLQNNVNID